MTNPAAFAAALRGPRANVSALVEQIVAAVQQSQTRALPPPSTMPRELVASAQILGEDPGLRRPLGVPGNAVFTAWTQAASVVNRFTILRGNGQVASVGTAVSVAPAIVVTDAFGRPRANVSVQFNAASGNGSVVGSPVTTGLDGVAAVTSWTLGPAPGSNTLQVVAFYATQATFVAFGIATRLIKLHDGNEQQGTGGTDLPINPTARVVEADSGQPIPGVDVEFTITLGGGQIAGLNSTTVTTDSNGIADAGTWTLGPTAGDNTLRARVAGADPVVFTAVAN